jgi:hypothetical protein
MQPDGTSWPTHRRTEPFRSFRINLKSKDLSLLLASQLLRSHLPSVLLLVEGDYCEKSRQSTMTITSLLSLSLLLASSLAFTTLPKRLSLSPQCHQRKKTHLPTRKIHLSELCYSWGEEDSAASAQPLPYSPKDLERLAELKTREITIPIVILDSILPGQKLYYQRYVIDVLNDSQIVSERIVLTLSMLHSPCLFSTFAVILIF